MRYQAQVTDAQWAAARALVEGEFQTHARVAAAMGINTTTVAHRAAEYGWKGLDFRHPRIKVAQRGMVALAAALREGEELDPVLDEAGADAVAEISGGSAIWAEVVAAADAAPLSELPPGERIARIGTILTRRTEAILAQVEVGRPVESRQVAALASLVQLAERIAVLARAEKEEELKKSDEELAVLYERLDNRISYLANEFARLLVVEVFGIDQAEVDAKLPRVEEADAAYRVPAVRMAARGYGP